MEFINPLLILGMLTAYKALYLSHTKSLIVAKDA